MAHAATNSPRDKVVAGFGDKNALIEKIKGMATDSLWLDRLNADKSWGSVSNKKLLHLHDVLEAVQKRFASRDEIIAAIMTAEGRAKDSKYAHHFASWSVPRLWDALRSAERRDRRVAVSAKTEEKAAKKPAKKSVTTKPKAKSSRKSAPA